MGRRWRVVVREMPIKVIEIQDKKDDGLSGFRLYRIGGRFVMTVFDHVGDYLYEEILAYGYGVYDTLLNAHDEWRKWMKEDNTTYDPLRYIIAYYSDKLIRIEKRIVKEIVLANADSY